MASKLDFGPIRRIDLLNCVEMPVAASQIFHPQGGAIVYLDSSGHVTLALTATDKIWGWAFVPRSYEVGSTNASNGYWTSSSTAAADKVMVAPFAMNIGMLFKMPTTSAGGLAVRARSGETCDIVGVNNGTVQYATPGTTSTDVLLFITLDPDGDTNSALFTANEDELQKDT